MLHETYLAPRFDEAPLATPLTLRIHQELEKKVKKPSGTQRTKQGENFN